MATKTNVRKCRNCPHVAILESEDRYEAGADYRCCFIDDEGTPIPDPDIAPKWCPLDLIKHLKS